MIYHPYIRLIVLIIGLLCYSFPAWSQANFERAEAINLKLDAAATMGEPINKPVTIVLDGTIQELLSFLAESTELNVSIDPSVKQNVSVSFTDALIRDIILYLCDAYDLDVRLSGSIIQLRPYVTPPKPVQKRSVDVRYSRGAGTLSMDLRQDTLEIVVRKISELTGRNIVVQPLVRNLRISGYINNVTVDAALEQLAGNNDLILEEKDGYTYLGEYGKEDNPKRPQREPGQEVDNLFVKRLGSDRVTVKAINVPILDLIKEVAIQLDEDYALLPEAQATSSSLSNSNSNSNRNRNNNSERRDNNGQGDRKAIYYDSDNIVSLQMKNATFADVLANVSKNSNYTWESRNGVYIIGRRSAEGLRFTRVYQLQNRSAKGIVQHIPENMTADVTIDTLFELNSLVLSGSRKNIEEITDFITSIDRLVPVVMIELMIVDVQKNQLREFGLEAGVTEGGRESGGPIIDGNSPGGGIDFTLSTGAINNILDLLAGANIINIGRVSSNFYLNLKAVEEIGIIDIKSTPKLSTLNSHMANMSIGETRYYQEQSVNFPGSDRPIPVQSTRFQSVEASLNIEIIPVVSGDEQVTLEIFFEQSEFIGTPNNAPPPQVSRSFESMIRVRNGEMIVLGGLDREAKSDTKRGIPGLVRIPWLGWLFGKKNKTKLETKLLIFVKPTIIN